MVKLWPNTMFSSYNALYKALLDAFGTDDYHLGTMVTGFEQAEHRVTVQLATGRTEQCDLLVCADGFVLDYHGSF